MIDDTDGGTDTQSDDESDGDDDDDTSSDSETDTDTDTDTEPIYPGGHYQFIDANPLSAGFRQTFRIRDFAGRHAFWFVFCPM